MKSDDLVLRCYARKVSPGSWYAVCIDLNIDAEAESLQDVKRSLEGAIEGYLQTVLESQEQGSIAHLIKRPSPLKDWMLYYIAKWLKVVRRICNTEVFKESIPIHLAYNCA